MLSQVLQTMENSNPDDSRQWTTLSDPLLFLIFKKLTIQDAVSCSLVCANWNSILQDNLLWKYFFRRDFMKRNRSYDKIQKELTLKPGAQSWKEEYIRLKDEYPCVKKQTLKGHTDEVLHAAFSHNGLEIASCSKVSCKHSKDTNYAYDNISYYYDIKY